MTEQLNKKNPDEREVLNFLFQEIGLEQEYWAIRSEYTFKLPDETCPVAIGYRENSDDIDNLMDYYPSEFQKIWFFNSKSYGGKSFVETLKTEGRAIFNLLNRTYRPLELEILKNGDLKIKVEDFIELHGIIKNLSERGYDHRRIMYELLDASDYTGSAGWSPRGIDPAENYAIGYASLFSVQEDEHPEDLEVFEQKWYFPKPQGIDNFLDILEGEGQVIFKKF